MFKTELLIDKNSLGKLNRELQRRVNAVGKSKPVIEIGFTAPYAKAIHENLEQTLLGQPRPSGIGTYWTPGGRLGSKYLERPLREMRFAWIKIVRDSVKAGMPFLKALKLSGEALLAEAKRRVPAEYGDLRDSGYIKVIS